MVTNPKGLPNKRVNDFNPNTYKLLARVDYSHRDINKLVKDGDTT
jgi:hypothetical protein